jgi:hypothetical protein
MTLAEAEVPITACTVGAKGVHVLAGGARVHAEAVATEVVDVTGAGDLFASGFLWGIVTGQRLADGGADGQRRGGGGDLASRRPAGGGPQGAGERSRPIAARCRSVREAPVDSAGHGRGGAPHVVHVRILFRSLSDFVPFVAGGRNRPVRAGRRADAAQTR